MRGISAIVLLLCAYGFAAAEDVPLPRPRPATLLERFAFPQLSVGRNSPATVLAPAPELQKLPVPRPEPVPSACQLRLSELATFKPLPALVGPGGCGAVDVIRLEAVRMPDQSRVTLNPPATLRCSMAEEVATWVRKDVGPTAASLGAPLVAIQNYDSFDCRGRNRVAGARLSEHGKANALDIRSLRLADGRTIDPTSRIVSTEFREDMRKSACARFMTVLGPGSDGYHENHIHVDLAERVHRHRLCRWHVREPPVIAAVPLPQPRPAASPATATRLR